jgi:hypothetical protein
MSANFETTVKLPSRGLLYKNIPEEITLRCMTTEEEKILYASTGGNSFHKILSNCIVNPKNIDLNELVYSDEHFLILQLRSHTYGADYTVYGKCPHCGHEESFNINLDEFDINYLDENFEEPIEITLPVSKDKLSLKLLRNRDLEQINRQAKKISKSTGASNREVEYILRMAKAILKVNDKEFDFSDAQAYVSKMHSRDSAYFHFQMGKVKLGVDTTVMVTCARCDEDYDFAMPINSEFFRPKFD